MRDYVFFFKSVIWKIYIFERACSQVDLASAKWLSSNWDLLCTSLELSGREVHYV